MEVDSRVPTINMEAAQKVIQQHLVLLLHAHHCQQKQRQDSVPECKLPYCQSTKKIISHIMECSDSSDCSFERCAENQAILAHWKHCSQKKRCPICGPVFVSQINNALSAMPPR